MVPNDKCNSSMGRSRFVSAFLRGQQGMFHLVVPSGQCYLGESRRPCGGTGRCQVRGTGEAKSRWLARWGPQRVQWLSRDRAAGWRGSYWTSMWAGSSWKHRLALGKPGEEGGWREVWLKPGGLQRLSIWGLLGWFSVLRQEGTDFHRFLEQRVLCK